jgi:hypothetical protein
MLPQMPDVTFHAETHEYTFKGNKVPSVTTIVSAAGLADFSHVNPAVLEAAKNRGRRAHMVTQAVDLDLFDDKKADETDQRTALLWRNARASFFASIKGKKPVDEMIEQVILSEKPLYAGTLDRAWEFPGKRLVIADIKTGGFYEKYCGLQLAGYAGALKPAYPGYSIETYVIQLKETFKIIPVPWAEYSNYFLSAYNIYQLKTR